MSVWTAAQNDAAWRIGFGGWLGDEAVLDDRSLLIVLIQTEAEWIERAWADLEAGLPYVVFDGAGELKPLLADDWPTALRAMSGLAAIGWMRPAPDGAREVAP
jgi:hypothetical protein